MRSVSTQNLRRGLTLGTLVLLMARVLLCSDALADEKAGTRVPAGTQTGQIAVWSASANGGAGGYVLNPLLGFQGQGLVFAAPALGSGAPGFRGLVSADLPQSPNLTGDLKANNFAAASSGNIAIGYYGSSPAVYNQFGGKIDIGGAFGTDQYGNFYSNASVQSGGGFSGSQIKLGTNAFYNQATIYAKALNTTTPVEALVSAAGQTSNVFEVDDATQSAFFGINSDGSFFGANNNFSVDGSANLTMNGAILTFGGLTSYGQTVTDGELDVEGNLNIDGPVEVNGNYTLTGNLSDGTPVDQGIITTDAPPLFDANTFLAAPSDGQGHISARKIVSADLPVPMTLTATGPGVTPLTIKTAAGQTTPPFVISTPTHSASVSLNATDATGYFPSPGIIALTGPASQTILSYNGVPRIYVDNSGGGFLINGSFGCNGVFTAGAFNLAGGPGPGGISTTYGYGQGSASAPMYFNAGPTFSSTSINGNRGTGIPEQWGEFNITAAQSGTAGYELLGGNVTEQSIGTGPHDLLNFRVNNVTKYSVDHTGTVTAASYNTASGNGYTGTIPMTAQSEKVVGGIVVGYTDAASNYHGN